MPSPITELNFDYFSDKEKVKAAVKILDTLTPEQLQAVRYYAREVRLNAYRNGFEDARDGYASKFAEEEKARISEKIQ